MGSEGLYGWVGLPEVNRLTEADMRGKAIPEALGGTRTKAHTRTLLGGVDRRAVGEERAALGARPLMHQAHKRQRQRQHAEAQGSAPSPREQKHSHRKRPYTKNPGSTEFVRDRNGGVPIVAQDRAQNHVILRKASAANVRL